MTPAALAEELGVSAETVRRFLRKRARRPADERGKPWVLTPADVAAVRAAFAPRPRPQTPTSSFDLATVMKHVKPFDFATVMKDIKPFSVTTVMKDIKPLTVTTVMKDIKPLTVATVMKDIKPLTVTTVMKDIKPFDFSTVIKDIKPFDFAAVMADIKPFDFAAVMADIKPFDFATAQDLDGLTDSIEASVRSRELSGSTGGGAAEVVPPWIVAWVIASYLFAVCAALAWASKHQPDQVAGLQFLAGVWVTYLARWLAVHKAE